MDVRKATAFPSKQAIAFHPQPKLVKGYLNYETTRRSCKWNAPTGKD